MMVERRCVMVLALVVVILLEIHEVCSVVGGSTAMSGTAPYIVALREASGSAFICAGVLVKLNWVLTTARCVGDKTNADLSILTGSQRLLTNKMSHTVRTIVKHPQYNAATGIHNLALLQLSEAVTVSSRIKTATLNDASVASGTVTAFYGWGAVVYGSASYSNTLQTLYQRTLSTTDCRTRVASLVDGEICAQIQFGQAACTKDEGGPLVQYGTEKLLGIYSHGTLCNGRLPDIFVDVFSHKSWIDSTST